MKDFIEIVFCILILTIGYALGYSGGIEHKYKDQSVVKSVEIDEDGGYKYSTTQFDFVSDSVYQVGDTIKITRY